MGNPEEHEPGKELGAERASQAQMAFAGSRRATRVYCERDPDADLDAHFIAGTFRAFFFFQARQTRTEAILARPLWHKRSVHYSGRGGVEKNNLSAGASPSA